ncbi:MAG: hypothetical protein LBQ81_08250 [Zoogloeaceae bacterium]|nr:hypothetical protein [Zoogloeaceae bacterium]
MTKPKQRNNDIVDAHLDAVLKASGSALRNYSMQGTLNAMRDAMRHAMDAAVEHDRKLRDKSGAEK